VPAGATHGVLQVTVKLDTLMVAGFMSSLKVALMTVLLATLAVGPGLVVAGTVSTTTGRVVSGVSPVVNFDMKGLAMAKPVAMLLTPVTVIVYIVEGARLVPAVSV
jgi:hypothetical protein